VLVDASHDNCRVAGKKEPAAQIDVLRALGATLRARPELRALVRGFLLESFLVEGCQNLERSSAASIDRRGLSVTDPCLSFERTVALLHEVAEEQRRTWLRRSA
jgi:3-deoxy-7-phosphoheptulonate synthase